MDELDRMYRRLVQNVRAGFPDLLTRAFEVSLLYQQIIPYRLNRRELGLDSNDEYELALLRLLSGERGLVTGDEEMQRALRAELESPNPDLSAFRARGARMIIYHGVADPVFSFNDTRNWYDGLIAASGGSNAGLGTAQSFVRLFPVPGMNHCGGGPATDRFDALTAIVDWVEQGVAPDSILASANPASGFAGRTRPLCPYPQTAIYNGSGSTDDAASFHCGGDLETRETVCDSVLVKYKDEVDGPLGVVEGAAARLRCRQP